MDEGFDDMFLKKYTQTANKHGKRCSMSLVTEEVPTTSRELLRTHTAEGRGRPAAGGGWGGDTRDRSWVQGLLPRGWEFSGSRQS